MGEKPDVAPDGAEIETGTEGNLSIGNDCHIRQVSDFVEEAIFTGQHNKIIKPATIEAAEEWLIDVLERTINGTKENRPGADDNDVDENKIAQTRAELKDTFSKLHLVIPDFVREYRKGLEELGLDPGKITVYQVGGRVTGTPLCSGSDIDLCFAFEKPMYPLHMIVDCKLRLKLLHEIYPQICAVRGIRLLVRGAKTYPGRFQIVEWGQKSPQDLEKFVLSAEEVKCLVLFENEGK